MQQYADICVAVCGHICSSMRRHMQQCADTHAAVCGHNSSMIRRLCRMPRPFLIDIPDCKCRKDILEKVALSLLALLVQKAQIPTPEELRAVNKSFQQHMRWLVPAAYEVVSSCSI